MGFLVGGFSKYKICRTFLYCLWLLKDIPILVTLAFNIGNYSSSDTHWHSATNIIKANSSVGPSHPISEYSYIPSPMLVLSVDYVLARLLIFMSLFTYAFNISLYMSLFYVHFRNELESSDSFTILHALLA
jgi:hypothetical protein